MPCQVALIGEADVQRRLGDRPAREQQSARGGDPPLVAIGEGRQADLAAKTPEQVEGAHPGDGGQVGEPELLGVVRVDEPLGPGDALVARRAAFVAEPPGLAADRGEQARQRLALLGRIVAAAQREVRLADRLEQAGIGADRGLEPQGRVARLDEAGRFDQRRGDVEDVILERLVADAGVLMGLLDRKSVV